MAHSVAVIGECMIELSGQGDNLWRQGFAGDVFNVAWALRALTDTECEVDLISAFGDDPFSHRLRTFLEVNRFGTASSPVIAGARPGLYAITLDGVERSFTYWRSASAARRLADDADLLKQSLMNRELIYFSGITLAILDAQARRTLLHGLSEARLAGAHIAFDPNYRSALWDDGNTARAAITQALETVDIALPTFPDEAALFGDATPTDTAARLEKAGVAEIVVKNGDRAATLLHYENRLEIAGRTVAAPLDTTGAGDAFNGAYLTARLLGEAPAQAISRAHGVAAAVIQVRGALAEPDALRGAFN